MAERLDKILECILFIEGEPVTYRRLTKLAGRRESEVREALKRLEARLMEQSGLRIVENGTTAQLVTAKEQASLVQKLFRTHTREELTRAALEVLSIIAYRGPISREKIEIIRGVNSAYIVRSLLMRGLISKDEGKDAPHYELSVEALRKFGLERKEDLPRWHELREDIAKAEGALSETLFDVAQGKPLSHDTSHT